jgi:transposase-like protein
MHYSQGFLSRQVRRMAGPGGLSANALSKEIGVSRATLSRWLRSASNVDRMSSESSKEQSGAGSSWSPEEKLALLARAAGLEGEALGAFLRAEGLHKSTLDAWRRAASEALREGKPRGPAKKGAEAKRLAELEREIRRKDKALAEMAALITLQKKMRAIWGDEEGSTTRSSEK